MKNLVIIEEKKDLDLLNVDYFIIGVQNLSEGTLNFSIDEIKDILKDHQNIIISINKIMHNEDFTYLQEVISVLDEKVIAFIFYDLGVLKLDIKSPLIYGGNYFMVNKNIINLFSKYVKAVLLNNEISLERQLELQKATNISLIPLVIGKPVIGVSKRVTNTGEFSESRGKKIVVRHDSNTVVFDSLILNKYELSKYFEYGLIRLDGIVNKQDVINDLKEKNTTDLGSFKGFLNSETYYEVKRWKK